MSPDFQSSYCMYFDAYIHKCEFSAVHVPYSRGHMRLLALAQFMRSRALDLALDDSTTQDEIYLKLPK